MSRALVWTFFDALLPVLNGAMGSTCYALVTRSSKRAETCFLSIGAIPITKFARAGIRDYAIQDVSLLTIARETLGNSPLAGCLYCRVFSRNSLSGSRPFSSKSGDITKQSTGEPSCHPLLIACTKWDVVSRLPDSRMRLFAIWPCTLEVRPNSALVAQVLMKFSFKNLMTRTCERATALKPLPLPQHASSASGPSIDMA